MAIPPKFGGGRVFLNDPEQAGLSAKVRDMAALNLQLIHLLYDAAVPNAKRGAVNIMAAHARQILAASEISRQREQATQEFRPITRIVVHKWIF